MKLRQDAEDAISMVPLRDAVERACVLVVDDQPANIQLLGLTLGKLGYEVLPASDGATALKRLAVRRPDLVLLDLLMPGMDGCEVCRRMQAHPEWQDIPVIFLSAADDKDLIVRALESGGVDFVTKPFHHAELVSRVRTQLALKAARDRVRQLAEDKDELMGILAHDLKNQLGGVQMSAEVLRNRMARSATVDQGAIKLAENISYSSAYLLNFVREFLANTAAEVGLRLAPIRLDLGESITSVVERYREAARRKDIGIALRLAQGVEVFADAVATTQVVENLLSNALKFTCPGRAILVEVEPGAEWATFRIRDQGPGFTEDDRARMFRRYTRLSARPTAGEPSTGLGLSIVHRLVGAMNGQLDCHSVPGEGATFEVRLPVSASA
jgi:two-component system sensor histidine kinase/response regulator